MTRTTMSDHIKMDLFLVASAHVEGERGQTHLVLLGVTTGHQMIIVEITDTTFDVHVPATHMDSLRPILKQSAMNQHVKIAIKKRITHSDKKEVQDMVHMSFRGRGQKNRLVAFCEKNNIPLYADGSFDMGDPSSTRLNSGIDRQCSWYRLDTSGSTVVTKDRDKFPKTWSCWDKERIACYITCLSSSLTQTETSPPGIIPRLPVVYMDVSHRKGSSTHKRPWNDSLPLEDQFSRSKSQWRNITSRIGGDFVALTRRYFLGREVDYVKLVLTTQDEEQHEEFTFKLREPNLVYTDTHRLFDTERELLENLFQCLVLLNPIVIVSMNIDTHLVCLQQRFSVYKMDTKFSAIFSKLTECPMKLMDQETLRCNYLMSSNTKLWKAEKQGMPSDKIRHDLKSKTVVPSHVSAFGTVVLNAVNWHQNHESPIQAAMNWQKANKPIDHFLEEVKMSGSGFVHHGAQVTGLKSSEIYNLVMGENIRKHGVLLAKENPFLTLLTEPLRGGLVLDPHPCFTFNPVIVLDFASLYASIIEATNLCPTTLCVSEESEKTYETLMNGIYCVCPSVRQGILPDILGRWKSVRETIKLKAIKTCSPDDSSNMCNKEQALKSCIVSIIGQNMTSSSKTPFHRPQLAHIVTSVGRGLMTTVIRAIQENLSHPYLQEAPTILGGDTDSVFVSLSLDLCGHSYSIKEITDQVDSIVGHIQNVIGRQVQNFVTDLIKEQASDNVLVMRVENISFASIHYTQKKRYVHTTPLFSSHAGMLRCKGVSSIHSDTIPLIARIEQSAFHILLLGWYLCQTESGHVTTMPPNGLMHTKVQRLYIPNIGWTDTYCVTRTDDKSAFTVTVSHERGTWTRAFMEGEETQHVMCVQQFSDEEGERMNRIQTFVQLITLETKKLKLGIFDIVELLETHTFYGHDSHLDRYDETASVITKTRQMFGLSSSCPHEKVYSVRIVKQQQVPFKWQTCLVTRCHQDPVIVLREHLKIDTDWYEERIMDHFCKSDKSLLRIITSEDVYEKVTNTIQATPYMETTPSYCERPKDIVECTTHWGRHATFPKEMVLLASKRDTYGVCHYFVKPEHCYTDTTLRFCQFLNI